MTNGAHDWGERVGGIVDGWLFSPQGDLPEALILPLEWPLSRRWMRSTWSRAGNAAGLVTVAAITTLRVTNDA